MLGLAGTFVNTNNLLGRRPCVYLEHRKQKLKLPRSESLKIYSFFETRLTDQTTKVYSSESEKSRSTVWKTKCTCQRQNKMQDALVRYNVHLSETKDILLERQNTLVRMTRSICHKWSSMFYQRNRMYLSERHEALNHLSHKMYWSNKDAFVRHKTRCYCQRQGALINMISTSPRQNKMQLSETKWDAMSPLMSHCCPSQLCAEHHLLRPVALPTPV